MIHGVVDLLLHDRPELLVGLGRLRGAAGHARQAQALADVLEDALGTAPRVLEAVHLVVLRTKHAELQQRQELICVSANRLDAVDHGLAEDLEGPVVRGAQHLDELLRQLEAIRMLEATHLLQRLATRRPAQHEAKVHVKDVALVINEDVPIVAVTDRKHVTDDGIGCHRPNEVHDRLLQGHDSCRTRRLVGAPLRICALEGLLEVCSQRVPPGAIALLEVREADGIRHRL
mmetsp:Transcript_75821/g.201437  ORF Transcript_75821/g.201437 Transcript_75821/m.201437 type:complete len:231 (+) Transcript_75821:283-975(+)